MPILSLGQQTTYPLLDSAIQNTRAVYSTAFIANSHLLNGAAYKDYEFHNYDVGHAYFLSDDWELGSVDYDEQHYDNVDLLYNTVRDKVIIDHPQGHFKLELIDEKLSSFTLQGHHFVRLVKDSATDIRTGYYDLLYDGATKIYVKQRKIMQEILSSRVVIKDFSESPLFYIYKDGKYNLVRSKSAVFKVFLERKNMLRKHLSKQNIRFRKNMAPALVESAKFFDESRN